MINNILIIKSKIYIKIFHYINYHQILIIYVKYKNIKYRFCGVLLFYNILVKLILYNIKSIITNSRSLKFLKNFFGLVLKIYLYIYWIIF